jgi:hypothetical protein
MKLKIPSTYILTIKVTQEDIYQGDARSTALCPIARALNRDYSHHKGLMVLLKDSPVIFEVTGYEIFANTTPLAWLPNDITEWVYAYDEWGPHAVGPIEFTVETF